MFLKETSIQHEHEENISSRSDRQTDGTQILIVLQSYMGFLAAHIFCISKF